ncbi:MAG: hypothetical protein US63_C0046G0004 [Candidatus Moranbacteria bacterium GW2011_GWC2_37_8]|nr:MAG: hypothetical protein US63_C0046G0004 [Candidatus Moranbacteria bacterium GW2011_GWC2_37_8]
MKNKKVLLILFAIILLGAVLRFYKLGELSFVADEFLDINSSYAYSQTGAWQSWDFNHGEVNADNIFAPRDERAWPYKMQVAQMFKLFAPTEAIARSVSVLWGILSIILIYFVAKYFTKKNTIGLLSAFLFAVSISGIIFDRRLRMYAMFFPVFLLFSWLLYKFYEQPYVGKHKWCKKLHEKLSVNVMYIIPAILVGALSMKVHDLTVSIAAIFSVYVIIMAGKSIYSKNSLLNKYTVTLGVILAVTTGAFIFAFDKIGKYAAGIKFFNDNFSYFSIVTTDYSHPIVALLFFAIGLYYLIKQKKATKEAVWLAVSFLVPFLMAVFLWRRNAGPQYIFFAQSFEIMLIASGIYAVADYLKNNLKGFSAKKTFMVAIILTVVLLPDWAYFAQENNVYNQTSKAENPNYREIFTYFKKKKLAGDVLLTRNFRNYYLSGQNAKVYDFGGELAEEKFPLSSLQSIVRENQSGWVILSDNDERYIANDAMKYIESSMTKINDVAVRGNVMVYRWGNK